MRNSERRSEAPARGTINGHVVFLKGVNVGGNNVFRPKQCAEALSHLDVVNVGAAGTFVVRARATTTAIKKEFLAQLPFEPVIALTTAAELMRFVQSAPFGPKTRPTGVRWWVAVLAANTKAQPELPIGMPAGKTWSVRMDAIDGRFAIGHWRRRPGGFVIPNQVVEKALGVPATVRWWETFERIAKVIEA